MQYIYQPKNFFMQQQSLSQKQLLKAHRIDHALQEYFDAHPEQSNANPCEVKPMLLEKGIFISQIRREGSCSIFSANGKRWILFICSGIEQSNC